MRYTTSPLTSSPILLLQDEKLRERLKDLFAYIPAISKKGSGTFERKRLDVFFIFCTKDFCFCTKTKRIVYLASSACHRLIRKLPQIFNKQSSDVFRNNIFYNFTVRQIMYNVMETTLSNTSFPSTMNSIKPQSLRRAWTTSATWLC